MTSTTSALQGREADTSVTPSHGRDQLRTTGGVPTAPTGTTALPMPPEADRRRWLALAVVMTAAFMDLVDVTIVNIAIPSIRLSEHATFSQIQWITADYPLALRGGRGRTRSVAGECRGRTEVSETPRAPLWVPLPPV